MPKRKPVIAELPAPEEIDFGALAREYIDSLVDLIVVLGPTASGKTRYAVQLAGEINACAALGLFEGCPGRMTEPAPVNGAEIISADSRQVYKGMDIGTGKDLSEYGDIPYHLIDILPAGAQYNVFRFQQDFRRVWADIRSRGMVPILCGGTGMYINAVTAGYDFTSKVSLSAGRGPSEAEGLPRHPYFIGTLVSREVRNERIDRRLDARLKEGMVEEIRGLLDSGVPAETLISYGLEYKYVTLYLQGQLSYEDMREKLATAIHQFAKRQMTWFRGMERRGFIINWIDALQPMEQKVEQVLEIVKSSK